MRHLTKIGHTFLHEAVDDHTRMAYAEFLSDETAVTSLGFMMRARQWFTDRGVTIQAAIDRQRIPLRLPALG